MTDTLTRISVPRCREPHPGILDWGQKTAPEMIAQVRAYADHMRAQVAAIDATADEDFQIEVVRGSVVQRHVRTVQQSANPPSAAPSTTPPKAAEPRPSSLHGGGGQTGGRDG
jgi:hypothetical protein